MKENEEKNNGLSAYAGQLIPGGAVVDFIFLEDFDGDGAREAFIGFTEFTPFPPESSILYIKPLEEGYAHKWLFPDGNPVCDGCPGIFENASAGDTDGDGRPELVVSFSSGNGHFLSLYVFDCDGDLPSLVWHSDETYYHGNAETADFDGDSLCEIAVERGTDTGQEILAFPEAGYHVREGIMLKWDGVSYAGHPFQVRMPYQSYNTAVNFLLGLWRKDYRACFKMAALPVFLGLDGLDDCSLAAFRRFVTKRIRPVLVRNLSRGKLVPAEPCDACCLFCGIEDDITVELAMDRGSVKVTGVSVFKRMLH